MAVREAAGQPRKEAIAEVAQVLGVPKRAVFDAVVAAKPPSRGAAGAERVHASPVMPRCSQPQSPEQERVHPAARTSSRAAPFTTLER